jgi:hypothetical protein
VIFALVAQRALEPGSKLTGIKWVAQRGFIVHLAGFSDDQAYRAMDFLLDALGEIASGVFSSVAHLLNQNIVFVDATSTDWEVEVGLTSWPRPWPATPATTRPPARSSPRRGGSGILGPPP